MLLFMGELKAGSDFFSFRFTCFTRLCERLGGVYWVDIWVILQNIMPRIL
tara:strand:+ start:112 stop:261 length:150 start_codon:yes stop_codon:yes gene_type:complete